MKQCPNCGFILNDADTACFKCKLNLEQYESEQNSMPDDVAQEVFQQAQSPLAQQPTQQSQQKQIYCTECGQTNNANSKFCGACGNKLEAMPIQQPTYQQPVYNYGYAQPKKKFKLKWYYIAIVILVPVIVFLALQFIPSSSTSKNWEEVFTLTRIDIPIDDWSKYRTNSEGKYVLPRIYSIKNNTNRTISEFTVVVEIESFSDKVKCEYSPPFSALNPNEIGEFSFYIDDLLGEIQKDFTIVTSCSIKKIKYNIK